MNRILFLLEDYNCFYTREAKKLIKENKSLTYKQILKKLISRKYYQSNSMAVAFHKLGFETDIVVPEANSLQIKWIKEHHYWLYIKWILQSPIRSYKARVLKQYRHSYNSIQFQVLLKQAILFKPTIIYFYSNIFITEDQIAQLKKVAKKLVLQWTCPIWDQKMKFPYHAFDLIITAALQLKDYFESKKIKTLYLQQAFDENILTEINKLKNNNKLDVIFIGNFSLGHNYRFEVLEYLLQNNINLKIFGKAVNLPENSLVAKYIKPPLFGIDMYNEYSNYKMAIHIHGTGVENDGIDWNKYAGAKRLFEITGSGTMLITSHQENVKDLFKVGEEIVTFTTKEDLLEKVTKYLSDNVLCNSIAAKGKERTLKDHTFLVRAKQLKDELFNDFS